MKDHPLLCEFVPKIELLAKKHGCVMWAMDANYTRSLFISQNYNEIWQRDLRTMYEDVKVWTTYLSSEMHDLIWQECKDRNTLINPKHTTFYSINLPDGHQQWFQDQNFHFNDDSGNRLMIAGAALPIKASETDEASQKRISGELDKICLEYYKLLLLPVPEMHLQEDKVLSELSQVQRSVLKLLLRGYTSKKIAQELHRSARTIEDHIVILKDKLQCQSKSEIIFKAIELHWLSMNL